MKKVFLLLVILFSINGFGCTCIKPEVKDAYQNADEIFIGEVIKIDSSHFSRQGSRIYLYDIKILDSYKHKFPKGHEIVSFISTNSGSSCDYTFRKDVVYLIYANFSSEDMQMSLYHTTICDRTTVLGLHKEGELEMLEKLQKENEPESDMTPKKTIPENEYLNLQKQAMIANGLALKTTYLIIISCSLFIVCLIFIFMYIKTKKKLKTINY